LSGLEWPASDARKTQATAACGLEDARVREKWQQIHDVRTLGCFWTESGCVAQQWSYNLAKSIDALDRFFLQKQPTTNLSKKNRERNNFLQQFLYCVTICFFSKNMRSRCSLFLDKQPRPLQPKKSAQLNVIV
jgi:hypothetical protein